MMRLRLSVAVLTALFVAGCAHRAAPPVASLAAYAPPPAAPMPRFASPNMIIPAALPDGSYPTPSNGISTAGAVWHLRAALNVAALSCSGTQGQTITAAYNRLLIDRKTVLGAAQRDLVDEYRGTASDYDVAMTRLYNFYAQFPAREGFCDAAAQVVTDLALRPDASLPQDAPAALAALDRPFTDFYRAYDAWRNHAPLAAPAVVALAAPVPLASAFHRIELGQTSVVAP